MVPALRLLAPPPLPTPCPPRLLTAAPSAIVTLLAELGAFSIRHDVRPGAPARSLGEHLLCTALLLRWAGAPEATVRAGALHSVYGTARFTTAVAGSQRARVAAAAGQRAEHLAHLFCALDRPRCLLGVGSAAGSSGGAAVLALRGGAAAGVLVQQEDLEALMLVEAANLLEQGDEYLLRVAAAPVGTPLRAALERVQGGWRSGIRPPVVVLHRHSGSSSPAAEEAGCCCCCCCAPGCLWRWGPALPPPALRILELPPPPPLPTPHLLPGCFLLDAELWGPLCPPHLYPALLLLQGALPPLSPAAAALPLQRAAPPAPCEAALLPALEAGQPMPCAPLPLAPRSAVPASELLQPHAPHTGSSSSSSSSALAAELLAMLAGQGYFFIDALPGSREVGVVSAAFAAAEAFFQAAPEAKQRMSWRSGRGGKFAGFRAEGARELFAVRDDREEGGGGGLQWPEQAWRALFELQRELARAALGLLVQGLGGLQQGVAAPAHGATAAAAECTAGSPSLAHLFGADSSSSSSSSAEEASPALEACADVMRVYRYQRPALAAGAPLPGLMGAATSAHCDVGLLTVAPVSAVPGLVLLSPSGRQWVEVEGQAGAPGGQRFVAFLGEAGARLLAGVAACSSSSSSGGGGGAGAAASARPSALCAGAGGGGSQVLGALFPARAQWRAAGAGRAQWRLFADAHAAAMGQDAGAQLWQRSRVGQ